VSAAAHILDFEEADFKLAAGCSRGFMAVQAPGILGPHAGQVVPPRSYPFVPAGVSIGVSIGVNLLGLTPMLTIFVHLGSSNRYGCIIERACNGLGKCANQSPPVNPRLRSRRRPATEAIRRPSSSTVVSWHRCHDGCRLTDELAARVGPGRAWCSGVAFPGTTRAAAAVREGSLGGVGDTRTHIEMAPADSKPPACCWLMSAGVRKTREQAR